MDEVKQPTRKELEEQDVKACAEKIQKALDEYGCELVGNPEILPDGRISSRVSIRTKHG